MSYKYLYSLANDGHQYKRQIESDIDCVGCDLAEEVAHHYFVRTSDEARFPHEIKIYEFSGNNENTCLGTFDVELHPVPTFFARDVSQDDEQMTTLSTYEEKQMYCIKRFYKDKDKKTETIEEGLTLAEAQAHCNDPSTEGDGWFDGYEPE